LSLNLKEIWELQRVFNILVGNDTVDGPKKEKWFFDYANFLHKEIIELFNCYNLSDKNIDVEKAKINAINCLHYSISLLHITKGFISEFENADVRLVQHWKRFKHDYFVSVSEKLFNTQTTDLLIYSTRLIGFKKIDSNNTKSIDLFIFMIIGKLMEIFGTLNFEIEDILKSYQKRYDEIKNELCWDDEKIKKYVDDFIKEKKEKK